MRKKYTILSPPSGGVCLTGTTVLAIVAANCAGAGVCKQGFVPGRLGKEGCVQV